MVVFFKMTFCDRSGCLKASKCKKNILYSGSKRLNKFPHEQQLVLHACVDAVLAEVTYSSRTRVLTYFLPSMLGRWVSRVTCTDM